MVKKVESKQKLSIRIIDFLLDIAILTFFICLFSTLFSYARETSFFTDECLHAYISKTIARDGKIPLILPEIFSGARYFYPPLFHILSAIGYSLFGLNGLYQLNLFLLIFSLIGMYTLISYFYNKQMARISCLTLISSSWIAIYTLRFYVEILTMCTFFFSFFFFYLVIESKKPKYAIWSGIATGLLLLSKQSGVLVLCFYFVALIWFIAKKNKQIVKSISILVGLALVISLPYFLRNLVCFGSPAYPLFCSKGIDKTLNQLVIAAFRLPKDAFLKVTAQQFGYTILIALIIPILYFLKVRFKRNYYILFGLLVFLFLAILFSPGGAPRHCILLLPLISFLCSYSITQVFNKNKKIIWALIIFLLGTNFYSVVRMPNYRRQFNLPDAFHEPFRLIKEQLPQDAKILSVWACTTLYYTGRKATWAWPCSLNSLRDLFEEKNVTNFYNLLNKYKINYILVDKTRIAPKFNSVNYPIHMIKNMNDLIKLAKVRIIYNSKYLVLLKVL